MSSRSGGGAFRLNFRLFKYVSSCLFSLLQVLYSVINTTIIIVSSNAERHHRNVRFNFWLRRTTYILLPCNFITLKTVPTSTIVGLDLCFRCVLSITYRKHFISARFPVCTSAKRRVWSYKGFRWEIKKKICNSNPRHVVDKYCRVDVRVLSTKFFSKI